MLTNEQRECFALKPIQGDWECIEAKASPYDHHKTYLYLDGDIVVKCIGIGDKEYSEYELNEAVSADRKLLLPKTPKGKPVILSSSTIAKRTRLGMCLGFGNKNIDLYNTAAEASYFNNRYLEKNITDINDFFRWVEDWCADTSEADKADVQRFAEKWCKHVKLREGDVFRFKIDRRRYGYGRLLLSFAQMRKKKEPFWDILMTKPLVCSAYRIITERTDVSVDELRTLGSLPSAVICDNALYYGEYEIIGNIPITEHEDYPIMYGRSISFGDNAICYQCGRVFRRLEVGELLYGGFINNGVSFSLNVTAPVLEKCVEAGSNEPYWAEYFPRQCEADLRNPMHADKLCEIRRQFGLENGG